MRQGENPLNPPHKNGGLNMALYHLSCKVLSKNKGHNMSAKYSYITRQNSYKQDDIAYYKSGNMPQFGISKPEKFWEAADLYERKNGTLARQLILALPIEFDLEQQKHTMNSLYKIVLPEKCHTVLQYITTKKVKIHMLI